jgi:Glu-tRNA(Gln) amidotransferase subunit E-like FAD-binding protein
MATSKAGSLITSTIETLDNGVDSAKPRDGASLIEEWLAIVKKDESTSGIANDLEQLYDQLSEKEFDKKKIAQLIKKLGDETAKAAKQVNGSYQLPLKDLGESLKDFAKELK